MTTGKILIGATLIAFASIGFLMHRLQGNVTTDAGIEARRTALSDCRPTFVDGGGPYYKENSPMRTKISPENANGSKLIISGTILKNDCRTAVPGAILDIWQADENGSYDNEWYRGRVTTNNNGDYSFETVIPKGYGEGTAFRPPHIHFKVWVGNQEIITSQMFFPESKGKKGFEDAYIIQLREQTISSKKVYLGTHPIILP